MIIGEVVGIYIDNKFIKEGTINSLAMRAISRMGYNEYSEVHSKFLMTRPTWSQKIIQIFTKALIREIITKALAEVRKYTFLIYRELNQNKVR